MFLKGVVAVLFVCTAIFFLLLMGTTTISLQLVLFGVVLLVLDCLAGAWLVLHAPHRRHRPRHHRQRQ